MSNQSEDHQLWESIKKIIAINVSVIFTLVIWAVLFISMLVGYFSIPIFVVALVLTYLSIREHFSKSDDSDK